MKVRVSDAAFTYDLLYSLRRAEYSAAQVSSNLLEVTIPNGASLEKSKLHLGYYLANWRARHPGVVADVVEPRQPKPALGG